MPASSPIGRLARRTVRVRGVVQGVGFRPFVYRLATEMALSGSVRNDCEGVAIDVQGKPAALDRFLQRLRREAPGLARIDSIEARTEAAQPGAAPFCIEDSGGGNARTAIGPDAAVCEDCLREMLDPADRRYRYAFINCTQCGPRYTITRTLPYDRANTSMASFVQCKACQSEYDDPLTRRFHAQPNACPRCGPRLSLTDAAGAVLDYGDPVAAAVEQLMRGKILAIKGLGGYHLACDARNPQAVARLRHRKSREEKPLAVMVAGAAAALSLAQLDGTAVHLLESRERPIVLLPKVGACDELLSGVAPGIAWLGVMLPYTPLHYLLFHEAAGRPAGTAWLRESQPLALVMTSANPGGEPLVIDNDEAYRRLHDIADAFLVHDRAILVRCDDSVVRRDARVAFVRRARGYTPRAIKLPANGPSVVATGAWLKNAVCVTRGDEAFLSQHVGDLDNAATCVAMQHTLAHLLDVLQVAPAAVAHDLHPDFHSTRFAADFAQQHGIPAIAVQHHHAHIAAVAAEHGVRRPVLGLALDGVGLGTDGTPWGGELLHVDGVQMQRVAHMRTLPLPGGDRAAREPWRMAAAALHLMGRTDEIAARFSQPAAAMVAQMLARSLNTPATSSAGRWFDAAAGLLAVKPIVSFEGQAAMLLEGLAARHGPVAPLSRGYAIDADGTLDLLPLMAALAEPIEPGYGAALFHATLSQALGDWVVAYAHRSGADEVALGGGCFMNSILSTALRRYLSASGLRVLEANQAPPYDGGLALGQALVGLQHLLATREAISSTAC